MLDLGSSDLAFTHEESVALLAAVGVELTEDATRMLTGHVEGWAAGLYLTALALKSPDHVSVDVDDAGRFVSDYLWTQHLSSLPGTELTFLTRSSVLERMSAPLCDAVLERHDSGVILDRIEHSNLFLVPLDRERRWFRYHELFRAALRDELDRSKPAAAADLRLRAADWCEANGLREEAMEYALASGDTDRMSRLLVALGPAPRCSGRAGSPRSCAGSSCSMTERPSTAIRRSR